MFVHVIPSDWGPYVDLRASYQSLARRRPWTHVITPAEYKARIGGELWNDPDVMFICWDLATADPGPHNGRRALVAAVYSEAFDDEGTRLLPEHLAVWHRFKDQAPNFDAVLAHTPTMATGVSRARLPGFVLPAGWDEAAMGAPRWDSAKHTPVLFHGSVVGRRSMIVPYLQRHLEGFSNVGGAYGRQLLGHLDTSRLSLYIAHSDVRSFSTWRLWQVASTSAALLAEPGDCWPFEPGRHLLTLEPITMANANGAVARIEAVAAERDLLSSIASAAHEEIARKFTLDHIEDVYLVPVISELQRVRR